MSQDRKTAERETINLGYEQLLVFDSELSSRPTKVIYRGIALAGAGESHAPDGRRAADGGPEEDRVASGSVTGAARNQPAALRRRSAGALGALGVLATAAAVAAAIWLAGSGHLPVSAVALLR